jgi:protein involved in polysaccharide export with SLBB domain
MMNRKSFGRWIAGLLLAAAGAAAARAAEIEAAPNETPAAGGGSLSISGTAAGNHSAWQQRLTLGPGDTLNLSLFDMPDTARAEVPVAPDGTITFLQARDITAAGLTIDELRAKLDESLGKFYQSPRTIITPAVFRSKKYLVLGSIAVSGVYSFDRPLTIIEAIARAGGLETGVYEQRTVEMTDLSRSFLVRQGQRVPVDLERLFQRGDLSQNVPLQPDDYLYFASTKGNEIYVLGEVMNPGVMAFAQRPTAISAITARGGFTTRSFKSRVLVVRGSLSHPQTFVVDTAAVLAGKAQDMKLQPKDIVYVSTNPWKVAAEIVDVAARSFVQSFVVEASTLHVGPIITSPWIK